MEKIKSFFKKVLAVILILGIIVVLFLNFAHYSDGTRAGIPMKLSKKGVIFKTWEGQLNVGGITNTPDGAIPTVWEFSVDNDADSVITKLNTAIDQGKRVKVFYKEKYIKFFWLGDTKYFAYKVDILK